MSPRPNGAPGLSFLEGEPLRGALSGQVRAEGERVHVAVAESDLAGEGERPSVRRESGTPILPIPPRRRGQASLLTALGGQEEETGRLLLGPVRDDEPLAVVGPGQTGVGPTAGPGRRRHPYVGHAPFRAAERGDQVDPGRAPDWLAEERDEAPVRGPGRALVVARVPSEPQRLAGSDELAIDIEVVGLVPVPCEGDLVPVGRERRLDLEARIGGERCRHGRYLGSGGRTTAEPKPRPANRRDSDHRDDGRSTPGPAAAGHLWRSCELSGIGVLSQLLQQRPHVVHVLKSAGGVLAHAVLDDPFQLARNTGSHVAHRLRLLFQDRRQAPTFVSAGNGRRPLTIS